MPRSTPPRIAPRRAAASKSFAVLRRTTSRYSASLTSALCTLSSCMTSPSAMVFVASASTSIMRMLCTLTIIWNAREVAERCVGGLSPAAELGFVDDIVVQQRRRMDELDDRCELVMVRPSVAGSPGGEQQQRRPQPLATARDNVLGHLPHQRHIGVQATANERIDGFHVAGDQCADRVERD